MSWEIWLAYALACMVLLAVPGPTILLVVGKSLQSGRGGVWYTVAGVLLGDLTALVLSMAGLGAALSTSAHAFTVLKWVGAAYLIWLGIKMWRVGAPRLQLPTQVSQVSQGGRLRDALHVYAVTALNPKGIVFFVAFLPQFIMPGAPVLPQVLLLGGTFLVLGGANAALYALLAGRLAERMTRPGTFKAVNRLGGTFLMGAGLMTAALKRVG